MSNEIEESGLGEIVVGGFRSWAILDLFGRQQRMGFVTEVLIAGVKYLRVETLNTDGAVIEVQHYSNSAIYCITPIPKERALAFVNSRSELFFPWEKQEASPMLIDGDFTHVEQVGVEFNYGDSL